MLPPLPCTHCGAGEVPRLGSGHSSFRIFIDEAHGQPVAYAWDEEPR